MKTYYCISFLKIYIYTLKEIKENYSIMRQNNAPTKNQRLTNKSPVPGSLIWNYFI